MGTQAQKRLALIRCFVTTLEVMFKHRKEDGYYHIFRDNLVRCVCP